MQNSLSTEKTSVSEVYQIQEKIAQLSELLDTAAPGIPTLLRDIHSYLKKDPDCVTILSPEECSVIVRGLKKQTSTEIATTAAKSKPKKSLKATTLDDL